MKASQCVISEQECAEPGFKLLDPLATCTGLGCGAGINERRGLAIAKTPGMARRTGGGTCGMRSGGSDRRYAVSRSQSRWECTCSFFVHRNVLLQTHTRGRGACNPEEFRDGHGRGGVKSDI